MSESAIERLMFRAIPLWLVLFLMVVGLAVMIAFSNIAIHTSKGGKKAGVLGQAVLVVSDLPGLNNRMKSKDAYLRIHKDFHPGKAGFVFRDTPGTRPDAGFLLLSRYDGDLKQSVIEYWDLNRQTLLHTWLPPIDQINDRATDFESREVDLYRDRTKDRTLVRHPLITTEGDLLIKSQSPLTRLDACNRIVWINDDHLFHHAVNQDDQGTLWLASTFEPPTISGVNKQEFKDDAVTGVTPDGEIVLKRSISALLLEKDMPLLVYNGAWYSDDPLHINDVQPVPKDGPHWKRGDLFVSMRNNSTILLYRPSTDEIVWWKQGPWSHQHDIDILDDHRISVFDNHSFPTFRVNSVDPTGQTRGHSDIAVYDFATDSVSYPWTDAMGRVNMISKTEGLHTVRPNGNLFVEEQNRARLFEIDSNGEVIWDYVNRGSDGNLYRSGWSRILEPAAGEEIASALKLADCPG